MDVQLPVTTWPGYAVPVPELPRYPDATLDGEIIWIPDWELRYWEMAAAAARAVPTSGAADRSTGPQGVA